MTKYVVVIEQEGDAWGAYAPDLPGCGVTGESRRDVEQLIGQAIQLHIESLRAHGEAVPLPGTSTATVSVV